MIRLLSPWPVLSHKHSQKKGEREKAGHPFHLLFLFIQIKLKNNKISTCRCPNSSPHVKRLGIFTILYRSRHYTEAEISNVFLFLNKQKQLAHARRYGVSLVCIYTQRCQTEKKKKEVRDRGITRISPRHRRQTKERLSCRDIGSASFSLTNE